MPVNVSIYGAKVPGVGGDSERESVQPCLLSEYLHNHDPDYHLRPHPIVSCELNGRLLEPATWDDIHLLDGDRLTIVLEPLGFDPITWVYLIIAAASAAYAYSVSTQIPDNLQTSSPQGASIYRADLQANRANKNGVIPEIFGKMPRYPDLIVPMHRKFINHEEWIYLGLSVGIGHHVIQAADIRIGETAIHNYIGDVSYVLKQPGVALTGLLPAEHWYTTREIGSTAGTSGLELKTVDSESSNGSFDSNYRYSFSDTELTITDNATPTNDISWFVNVDDLINVNASTTNDGRYRVASIGSPDNVATLQKQKLLSSAGLAFTWIDDPAWTGFTSASDQTAVVVYSAENGPWSNWVNVLPENETTQKIEIDYRFPRGLGKFDDAGNVIVYTVVFEFEYREVGGASTSMQISHTEATRDERAFTYTLDLPAAIEPQIRFSRITAEKEDSKYLEAVEVVRVKGQLPTANQYDDVTTIWFSIKGTNAIAKSAENQINLDAQRLLPTAAAYKSWRDTWYIIPPPKTAHSQIAAAYIYLTNDVGYSLDAVDLDALVALQEIWTARGDTFDAEITEESTLYELQKRILAVGYAEPTIENGLMTGKRDGIRSTYDYLYTPDKILPPGLSRSGELYDPDENDGVEVEYFNRDTRQNDVIRYTLAAAGDPAEPLNPKKLRAFGITDPAKAWRFGSIERRRLHFKPDQITFDTEMDGLNSTYLSSPAIADDASVNCITGFVVDVTGTTVEVDTKLTFEPEQIYKIAFSKPDGSLSGLYDATAGSHACELTISEALDFVPALDGSIEPPLFAFGKPNEWAEQVIIRDIQPQNDDQVKLVCEEYMPEIWADIDNSPV